MRVQAGTTLTGSVVDSNLTPLAGVVVTLERGSRVEGKTATAADGRFRFASVNAGDYQVRAELSGFVTFTRALSVRAGVEAMQLPIVLARPGEKREQQAQS